MGGRGNEPLVVRPVASDSYCHIDLQLAIAIKRASLVFKKRVPELRKPWTLLWVVHYSGRLVRKASFEPQGSSICSLRNRGMITEKITTLSGGSTGADSRGMSTRKDPTGTFVTENSRGEETLEGCVSVRPRFGRNRTLFSQIQNKQKKDTK